CVLGLVVQVVGEQDRFAGAVRRRGIDDDTVLGAGCCVEPAVLGVACRAERSTACRGARRASSDSGGRSSRAQSYEHRSACSRRLTHIISSLKMLSRGPPAGSTHTAAARLHGPPEPHLVVDYSRMPYRDAKSAVARAITL